MPARLKDPIIVLSSEPLAAWSHLWRTGRFGTRNERDKLRGAVDCATTECVGLPLPEGRVIPARFA